MELLQQKVDIVHPYGGKFPSIHGVLDPLRRVNNGLGSHDIALAFGGLVHYHATLTVIDPALALYIA